MKSVFNWKSLGLLVTACTLTACLDGGSGGGGGNGNSGGGGGSSAGGGSVSPTPTPTPQPPTPPTPTPSHPPLQVQSTSPANAAANVSARNFNARVSFNNNLANQTILVNTNTSADMVQLIDSSGLMVPITVSLSGSTLSIRPTNNSLGLRGNDRHRLIITTALQDVHGGSLGSNYSISFSTEFVAEPFPGFVTMTLNHSYEEETLHAHGPMQSFLVSFGTESQAQNGRSRDYNARNEEVLVVSPMIPAQTYGTTTFTAQIFYPFNLGQRYYFTAKACARGSGRGVVCSEYSIEATKDIPSR